eukprot:gnl/TRDRNA2_/TRDRNA2_141454_c1_seq1.p1 gnl/TRDRNA2_/TRDRNA2_141454_c1~~gnl/TRDRNA2_/TRDRNA2_141454_c1_seq1.p1  ORF type:complete len:208 (-),score=24.59 gnl/TRDRNA2_/TRDRNA2_141454_c1_seq1:25-648(-)
MLMAKQPDAIKAIAIDVATLPPVQRAAWASSASESGGDEYVGAGPPYPDSPQLRSRPSRSLETEQCGPLAPLNVEELRVESGVAPGSRTAEYVRHNGVGEQPTEVLLERIAQLDAQDEGHERLKSRIRDLEENLEKLGRESLERLRLGLEQTKDRYKPGASEISRTTSAAAAARSKSLSSMPGVAVASYLAALNSSEKSLSHLREQR